MAKVTSKLQVTIPKKLANEYHIRPGDEVEWVPAGEVIRVVPSKRRIQPHGRSKEERLRIFQQMLDRQREREAKPQPIEVEPDRPWKPHEIARGWRREDLYTRGRSR